MNERPRRFGLQAWLVAAFVAVGAIASLAVALVVLPRLESSIRTKEAERLGADLIRTLRTQETLSGIDVEADLDNLAVAINGDARVTFLGSGPAVTRLSAGSGRFLPAAGTLSASGRDVRDGGAPSRYVAVSVDGRFVVQAAQRGTLGGSDVVIEAAAPVRGAENQIALLRRRVLTAIAVVLGLASLVGWGMAHLLGVRIRRIAGTARTLAGGDLSARATEVAPQELTSLGESLNAMAARLEGLVAETVGDRDRARGLIASLTEGVLAVSVAGEVTIANSSAQRLLGLSGSAGALTLQDLPSAVREVVEAALEDPDPDRVEEVSLAGGIETLVRVSPLTPEAGLVLTIRDVTEERRLARARRDLIANVSHELKTPLTAIKGLMELLESERLEPERRTQFFDLMSQEVLRLERLVAEQLELARLDAGALALEREPVDLGDIAEEIAASRRDLAEHRDVTLSASPAPGPVVVDADPARIEQILLILLDNALRHTPAGGKITIGVGIDGGEGTISVRDTGGGIPLDAQPFIFDRFYQADQSREGQGLGLGLAIARGLAAAHGGSIQVRSAPAIGSVFTVRLPLAPRAADAPPPPRDAARSGAR